MIGDSMRFDARGGNPAASSKLTGSSRVTLLREQGAFVMSLVATDQQRQPQSKEPAPIRRHPRAATESERERSRLVALKRRRSQPFLRRFLWRLLSAYE